MGSIQGRYGVPVLNPMGVHMSVKVKLLVSRTGGQNRGDVITVSKDEAPRMIAAGQAIPFKVVKREKAVKRKKETR